MAASSKHLQVRRTRLVDVVGIGATRLVLPEAAVKELGLPPSGKLAVRFTDGRRDERKAENDAEEQVQGRSGAYSALVELGRSDALAGAIVIKELDFVADCIAHKLFPRDPKQPLVKIEQRGGLQGAKLLCCRTRLRVERLLPPTV